MKHEWTYFEKEAAAIVRNWINDQAERIADAGGLRLEISDAEPTILVKLLAEALVEIHKTRDAQEMRLIRYEGGRDEIRRRAGRVTE